MALKIVKGNLERILDKNLADLVRGIRNNKENEAKYITSCIEEIKQELRQDNISVKANAVSKLTYLQMLGYDISWAGFNIIEVMSSSKFTHKRIGYLAASQSFHQETEVLMLTTNMIRKDLNSQNQYDAGGALSGLSCFISCDLARDLANDIMTLLTSTKPYLRKKAVLMLYKVFLRYPDALRPAFPRLKEKLEDPDPGVQSAAVNVICELARKNPKNYLSLAPVFFKLMTSSTNNWMLIKIIKLTTEGEWGDILLKLGLKIHWINVQAKFVDLEFGALTPLEPRLGKKLIEPLTNLIHSTSAMSLLYECINTVIAVLISISTGMPNHDASIQLCVQKLRILIEDSDQNLKYLGLLAMSKILKTHPKSVQSHKDLIMQCLDDRDESIRLRALDLLYGMVSKKNLMEIVKKLLLHMDRAEGSAYRDELLNKIVEICSQNDYQHVTNFEWYIDVLVELSRVEGVRQGIILANQFKDVAIRVPSVRPFAVQQAASLLEECQHLQFSESSAAVDILYAAAYICGEFAEHLREPKETLKVMVMPKVASFPPSIQAVFVHNALKLYSHLLVANKDSENFEEIKQLNSVLMQRFQSWSSSGDLDVQERTSVNYVICKLVDQAFENGDVDTAIEYLQSLFHGDLNPVASKAQKKVPVPDGLDLDQWINEAPPEDSDEDDVGTEVFYKDPRDVRDNSENYIQCTEEDLAERREVRRAEQSTNPHYLKSAANSSSKLLQEEVPVVSLDLDVPLQVRSTDRYKALDKYSSGGSHSRTERKRKKKKKESQKESEDEAPPSTTHQVVAASELPDGALPSDDEHDGRPQDDPHKALDINLEDIISGSNREIPSHSRVKDDSSHNASKPQLESPDVVVNGHKEKKKNKKKDKIAEADLVLVESDEPKPRKKKSKEKKRDGKREKRDETHEIFDKTSPAQASDRFVPIARNDSVQLACIVSPSFPGTLAVQLKVRNTSGDSLTNVDVSLVDTINAKLIRMDPIDDLVRISPLVPCDSEAESSLEISISSEDIPVTIRGSLEYSINSVAGSNRQKLDYRLSIPVSSHLVSSVMSKTQFTEMLQGDTLPHKLSSTIPVEGDFRQILRTLCSSARVQLIEQIDSTASFSGSSSLGSNVAFLLKFKNGNLQIDGKSDNKQFLSSLIEEFPSLVKP